MKLARPGVVVHRAGRRWRVRPGQAIRLLDGDVVETEGCSDVVELARDELRRAHPGRARPARSAAALSLATFLGLTSPVLAETAAPAQAETSARPVQQKSDRPAPPKTRPRGGIEGRVIVAATGKAVDWIRVVLADDSGKERSRTRTDQHGKFQFLDLPPGRYRVRVDRTGLAPEPDQVVTVKRAVVSVTLKTHEDTLRLQTTSGF